MIRIKVTTEKIIFFKNIPLSTSVVVYSSRKKGCGFLKGKKNFFHSNKNNQIIEIIERGF